MTYTYDLIVYTALGCSVILRGSRAYSTARNALAAAEGALRGYRLWVPIASARAVVKRGAENVDLQKFTCDGIHVRRVK